MATVYITKELENRVHNKIVKMRDQEVQIEVPSHDKSITVDASELLMQMAWGDYKNVFPQLPKEWLKHSKSQDINVVTGVDDKNNEMKYCINVTGLSMYYEIPTVDRWSGPRPSCSKQWLETRMHLTGTQDILDKLAEKEICTTIHAKWGKVDADIKLFLSKCKSLNEALRLWPALKMYVPHEYIERVETKVERRRRDTEITEVVNLEELTATAIAAKLSGVV
jgi:hypothetical protein